MRLIDERGELFDVAPLQRLCRLVHAGAFVHHMFGSVADFARQNALRLLEHGGGYVRKARNIRIYAFQLFERFLHLGAPLVVLALHEVVRLVAVGDDDLVFAEFKGYVFVFERLAVEKHRPVLFAHCGGELIHDAAVDAAVLVFRPLGKERHLL